MICNRKIFTIGSIASMAIMFVALMFGFVIDYYSYYYVYSFAEYAGIIYWPFFVLTIAYIAIGVIAIALYNKHIKALNIANLILTFSIYVYAVILSFIAMSCYERSVFGIFMLLFPVSIGLPFHFIVDILATYNKRIKGIYIVNLILTFAVYILALIVFLIATYESHLSFRMLAPVVAAIVGCTSNLAVNILSLIACRSKNAFEYRDEENKNAIGVINDSIETLKRIKELYDSGVLTEEEYTAKRQQHINKI